LELSAHGLRTRAIWQGAIREVSLQTGAAVLGAPNRSLRPGKGSATSKLSPGLDPAGDSER